MCETTSKLYLLEPIGTHYVAIPMEYQNKYKINSENLTIEYGRGSIGLMDYYSKDTIYHDKFKACVNNNIKRDIETIEDAFKFIEG